MYQQDQPQPLLGSLLLLVTAVIWGCAFVAQSVAMDFVKPFTFCGARFLLSGTALVPVILLRKRMGADDGCSRPKVPAWAIRAVIDRDELREDR